MPETAPRERRTVSVLFSDLTGFTRMAEDLDPEEVSDIVDALFRRFRTVIESEGGTVDKFIGDAVMAVFGAPAAHEDDAARSVRAGLAMQKEIALFNAERGLSLAMRVGVNTGEVLWGSVGGGAATAMGDTVNVAQRLESAARPGTVLIGPETESAVRRRFRCSAREPVAARGRDAKIAAFEVEQETAALTEVRTSREPPMVGRGSELASLVALLDAERAAFVLLEGEAGTGKSRLLAEIRKAARGRRIRVDFGRAAEGARLPLSPFADMLRASAGSPEAPAVVAAAVAGFTALTPVDAENTAHLLALSAGWSVPAARVLQLDPERRAAETAAAWARWIRARSPALLCVEDVHWADDATRALLAALPPLLAGARVVVAASARPGSPPIAGFDRVRLRPLESADIRTLATEVLGAPPDDSLHRFIADYAGGNPYCAAELASHLVDSRLVEGTPARLRGSVIGLPATLNGLLTARLDALPNSSKEALKAASVLGRTFWRGMLSDMLGEPAEEALEEPRRRGLVFARANSVIAGDDAMMFQHALLRDAAYALLPRKDRQRLHARAADSLEKRAVDRRLRAMAAEHRKEAGEAEAAAKLWLQAAEEAKGCSIEESLAWALESRAAKPGAAAALLAALASWRLTRYAEAGALAQEALSDPAATLEERQRARIRLADFLAVTGKQGESLVILESMVAEPASPEIDLERESTRIQNLVSLGRAPEALEVLAQLESRQPAAAATSALLRVRSSILRRLGRLLESEAAAERSLELAEKAGDLNAQALSRNELAHVLSTRGLFEQSIAHHRQAQTFWRAIGNRRSQLMSLHNIGAQLRHLGKLDEAAALLAEALASARECGDVQYIGSMLSSASTVASAQGRYAEARGLAGEAIEIWRRTGERLLLSSALNNLAVALDWLGEWDKALEAHEEALRIRREIGNRNGEARSLNNIGLLLVTTGRFPEARDSFAGALAIARDNGDLETEASTLVNSAKLQRSLGNLDASIHDASRALEIFRSLKTPEAVAECLQELAKTRALRCDLAGARAAVEEALCISRETGHRQGAGSALVILGTIEMSAGNHAKAAELLEEALALARTAGERAGVATAQKRLAGVLAASGRVAEAESLLLDTLELERSIGAVPGIAATLDLLAQTQANLGRLHEAVATARESADLRRRIGDRPGLAVSLYAVGNTLSRLGQFAEAGASLEESLAICRSLGIPRGEGIALLELGNLRLEEMRHIDAIAFLREALPLVKKHGEPHIRIHALTSLSSALRANSELPEAAVLLGEAVKLARSSGDRAALARVLVNTAIAQYESGDPAGALDPCREALSLYRGLDNLRGVAAALLRIGRFEAALGRSTEARAALEESARAFSELRLERETADARREIEMLPRP